MKKRIISIILTICLIMSLVPTNIYAAEDPEQITGNAETGTDLEEEPEENVETSTEIPDIDLQ